MKYKDIKSGTYLIDRAGSWWLLYWHDGKLWESRLGHGLNAHCLDGSMNQTIDRHYIILDTAAIVNKYKGE